MLLFISYKDQSFAGIKSCHLVKPAGISRIQDSLWGVSHASNETDHQWNHNGPPRLHRMAKICHTKADDWCKRGDSAWHSVTDIFRTLIQPNAHLLKNKVVKTFSQKHWSKGNPASELTSTTQGLEHKRTRGNISFHRNGRCRFFWVFMCVRMCKSLTLTTLQA